MSTSWQLISADNPVFRNYAAWTGVLVLKTLGMSALTGLTRFRKKAFANPEDTILHKIAVNTNDEDVERTRRYAQWLYRSVLKNAFPPTHFPPTDFFSHCRAHRNDLENVLPLIVTGFVYVLADPPSRLAIQLYQAAVLCRISHTIVYAVWVVPQPARAIAWFVPWVITGYMAVEIITRFW